MIRDTLEEKVREGVRIYEYQPRFNHSKTAVCDDRLSWIGSVNLDCRSLQINYEVAARIEDPDLTRHQARPHPPSPPHPPPTLSVTTI